MFFPRVEVFKVVILYTVVVLIGYCMFLDVSSVVTTTTRCGKGSYSIYNVMNKQTQTLYHYDYVSIFCFTSFNTFWKYLWLRKLAWDFFGYEFLLQVFFFFGFCLKPNGYFWFWFCSFKRLKNKAWALGQNSIFNYREHWEYFYLAGTSQVKFETYRAGDYYRLLLGKKHESPLILAQKDGKEIFQ